MKKRCAALPLLMLLIQAASAAEVTNDVSLGITFAIPANFARNELATDRNEKLATVHTYVDQKTLDQQPPTFFQIQDMHGLIGQEPLGRRYLQYLEKMGGANAAITNILWNGLIVEMVSVDIPTPDPEIRMCCVQVQVPVTPSAIQINVGGPLSDRARLEKLMIEILSQFKARSNWIKEKK